MKYHVKEHLLTRKPWVHFECENCRIGLMTDLKEAGTEDTCPECQRTFITPGGAELLERLQAKEERKSPEEREVERKAEEDHRVEEIKQVPRKTVIMFKRLFKRLSVRPVLEYIKRKPEDYVLAIGLIVFVLAGLFPPWQQRHSGIFESLGYSCLFMPPERTSSYHSVYIDTRVLHVEWILIGVVTAVVYFIVRNRLQSPKPPPLP